MNSKVFLPVYVLVILVVTASCAGTPSVPVGTTGTQIIQPGAPGEMAQAFDTAELEAIGGLSHSEADVRFMRGMIPHHGQALDMTALVPTRATTNGFRSMALRMQISQRDEIRLMERWLTEREEDIPPPNAHRMMMAGDMALMPGMLSAGQMEQLTSATGQEFERLFLEFMIMHHEGALTMVQTLFNSSGAGQESLIFKFATDVDADQTIEILRMRRMLEERR
ncbi:MAG: DUF305 domain-containing protein [Gemmatimonadetes bacterium]|nr:DUF305 domain-containing protein [Gemmatimonadota bacterium]